MKPHHNLHDTTYSLQSPRGSVAYCLRAPLVAAMRFCPDRPGRKMIEKIVASALVRPRNLVHDRVDEFVVLSAYAEKQQISVTPGKRR